MSAAVATTPAVCGVGDKVTAAGQVGMMFWHPVTGVVQSVRYVETFGWLYDVQTDDKLLQNVEQRWIELVERADEE